jgi:hypothetical protein
MKRVSRKDRELPDAFENSQGLVIDESRQAEVDELLMAGQQQLIEQVPPSRVLPDWFQPRPVLPTSIQFRFRTGQLSCYEAAEKWLGLAEKDGGHKSRIDDLLSMAASAVEHGQIKPITGSWVEGDDGDYTFKIETGERRFWAMVLHAVTNQLDEEPLLRIEAIENPSVERQVVENRHAEPPTAVAQAREIAALVLAQLEIYPDEDKIDPYDYYRMALNPPGRERLPKGTWENVGEVMSMGRRRMAQYLELLKLPTPLLELADRYEVPERVLREIVSAPAEHREKLLTKALQEGWTSDQLAEAASELPSPSAPAKKSKRKISSRVTFQRTIGKLAKTYLTTSARYQDGLIDEAANFIAVHKEGSKILEFLEELTRLTRARLGE